MRVSIRRLRFVTLGLTVPALLAGGLMAAGGSTAAPAPAAGAGVAKAQVKKMSTAQYCRGTKLADRRNIRGHKNKLIGHVSLYIRHLKGAKARVCVRTWRNGVAYRNKNLTVAELTYGIWHPKTGRCDYRLDLAGRNSGVSSPRARASGSRPAQCMIRFEGRLLYKGYMYESSPGFIWP